MGADGVTFQDCVVNVLCSCTDLRMVDQQEIMLRPGENDHVNAQNVSTMYLDGNPVAGGPFSADGDATFTNQVVDISGPYPDGTGYYLDLNTSDQQGAAGKKTTARFSIVQWEKLSKKELICAEGRLARAAKIFEDRPEQLELVKRWAAIVEDLKARK